MVIARAMAVLLLLAAAAPGWAAKRYVYVGDLGPTHALIAWGATSGNNTIGRSSPPLGKAEVKIGGRSIPEAAHNWVRVTGLLPDNSYEYEVTLDGGRMGGGRLRTWAARADRLAFFVIGDFGNGGSGQRRVAEAMWREFARRQGTDNPVRFVLTTGDNIYANLNLGGVSLRSGDHDRDWESKYFRPYERLLAHVPFYATLGNHDGNATESQGDLDQYLDNFFFPTGDPARWYRFGYAGLADFFALDSSESTRQGRPAPVFLEGGEQFQWMKQELAASRAPWKIAYFHHPPYSAGPRHGPSLAALTHFVDLFRKTGVRVVFNGHEHNLQFSDPAKTGRMLFVVTGAGGELRRGDVTGDMERQNIAAWSAQRHFLSVTIEGRTMRILPVSYEDIVLRDSKRQAVRMPVEVKLP